MALPTTPTAVTQRYPQPEPLTPRDRGEGLQRYVYTRPSTKSIQAIKDKVKVKTYRSTRNQDLDKLLKSVNQALVGWARYFRYGVSKAIFGSVDYHAWGRLMRWIRVKYKGKKTRLRMREMRRRFCDQGWRFAYNGVVFTGAASVKVERYGYRGSKIPTPWALDPSVVANG